MFGNHSNDAANTAGGSDLDLGLKAQQRGRRIGRKGRPAPSSAGCNVAEVAVLLDAEATRRTPGQRLVVPETPRIETYVAADRAHVAQNR